MNNFFLIAFLKISFESLKLFYLKYFSLLIILHGLHKNFLLLKLKVKRKNIRNLCLFFAPYHRAPYLWYKVHILTTSNEKTSSNFGYYVTKRNVVNSSQILLILTTMPCHFEKKNFLSGIFIYVLSKFTLEVTLTCSFNLVSRKLRNWDKAHVLSQTHAAPNFLLFSC